MKTGRLKCDPSSSRMGHVGTGSFQPIGGPVRYEASSAAFSGCLANHCAAYEQLA